MTSTVVVARPGPVSPPLDAEVRLHSLDILRGLALFFMILVHFHQKMRIETSGLEDLIGWFIYIFVEEKAWGTFAFLFGAGFAILLQRLDARQQPATAIFLRRLAVLAVFGVIAQVGFGFSILFSYSLWGLALLVVRRWSTRALLVTAGLSAAARPVIALGFSSWVWWNGAGSVTTSPSAPLYQALQTATAGSSYLDLLAARWNLFVVTKSAISDVLIPDTNFALFIIGLLAVRHGVIDAPRQHARLIKQWMLFGAASWFLSWVVLSHLPKIPIPGAGWQVAAGFGVINEQWLCFTYIGAWLLLLDKKPEWIARLAPIGQAGRMALTNYMIQVAVLDYLASGYGVGLKLRPLVYLPAATVLFAIQASISTWWLARYRFGPLEWVWRTATYLQLQPLRSSPRRLGI